MSSPRAVTRSQRTKVIAPAVAWGAFALTVLLQMSCAVPLTGDELRVKHFEVAFAALDAAGGAQRQDYELLYYPIPEHGAVANQIMLSVISSGGEPAVVTYLKNELRSPSLPDRVAVGGPSSRVTSAVLIAALKATPRPDLSGTSIVFIGEEQHWEESRLAIVGAGATAVFARYP